MPINSFDHINVRTANLDAMVKWYGEALGLTPGARPAFSFPGAWLYLGDQAIIHLVGIEEAQKNVEPQIEHFALNASDLKGFLSNLDRLGTGYNHRRIPSGSLQIGILDPDGNHLHVDFTAEEADAAGL